MSDSTVQSPEFVRRWINLAQPRLGARALAWTDDWFAPAERMLLPEPAVFIPGKYDDNGKWMDGWETRRRRNGGHDHCVVRLGLAGVICGLDIDTSNFTGNYPPAASLEAYSGPADPGEDGPWQELLPSVNLQGNAHHYFEIRDQRTWTHVRLHIYPDGGVARLRVYGQVQCNWEQREAKAIVDLAAMENGGRAIAWNDAHFGEPANLLAPGRGVNMGDGWETRRRREPGNDWCIIALGHRGTVQELVLDTCHFKGNFPDRCSIQAADVTGGTEESLVTQSMFWPVLLPEQNMRMDALHHFREELLPIGRISHVRLNVHPDGGVSRMRVLGQIG